jgi:AcrR family transcriptional regulator
MGLPLLNPLPDLKRQSVQFSGNFKAQSVERSRFKNSRESVLTIRMMRRREGIVRVAFTVFDRDGFEAAKMGDIARETQVAKCTLYLHFDTKIDLLEAVILTEVMPTLQKM